MKTSNSVLYAGSIILATSLLTGCASSSSSVKTPISYYAPNKMNIVQKRQSKAYVNNGALILEGNKIYDEGGDIISTFTIDNRVFYLLDIKDKKSYLLKDINKKTIKEFPANAIKWFVEQNNVIFAVRLPKNRSTTYDNIYSFDGKNIKLIDKNRIIGRSLSSGLYLIDTLYNQYGLDKYIIRDIRNNKNILLKPKSPGDGLFGKNEHYYIVGALDNNIFYTYKSSNGKTVLEAFNVKSGEKKTLLDESKKVQFLKSENTIVLKIFNNKNLEDEFKMYGYYKNLKSKYDNEPAKYICLNTLNEVKGVTKDFNPILIYSSSSNLGGSQTKDTRLTYDVDMLHYLQYSLKGKTRSVKTLF